MAKQSERTFTGSRKGVAFTVTSRMTDEQVTAHLTAIGGKFAEDCAFEVGKLKHAGLRTKETLVAWGFKLAEERANPPKGIMFDPAMLARFVVARRPLRFQSDGNSFEVGFCGPASKQSGSYRITNGEKYGSPDQAFYGYITPAGEWKPTRAATPEVINAIVSMLTGFSQ